MAHSFDYDLVIVGSGIAGHCAALAALEYGARVLMSEAAPQVGGSSRLSSGVVMGAGTRFQRARGIEDHPETLYQHYMNLNQWMVQPSIARRLCYEAGPAIEWLADRGVEFVDLVTSGTESAARGHVTRGGDAIIEALATRLALSGSVDTVVGSRIDRLLLRDGAVIGVASQDQTVTAASVVIACGGLGASLEMLSHWNPESFWGANGPIRYYGERHAQGDVVRFGMQVEAQIVRGKGIRNIACVFLTSYLPSFALVVNQLGRRFHDETASYAIATALLERQPGGVAYLLFDDALKRSLTNSREIQKYIKIILVGNEGISLWHSSAIDDLVAQGQVIKADSLTHLAHRLGLPVSNLAGTLQRYNRLVASGVDSDYFKDLAHVGPISTPPFYSAKLTQPGYGLTGTGLRIDENAAVIHESSEPIPGLFAAGEATGNVIGDIYFGSGNSLASCAVFGRLAGRHAAERASAL